MFRLIQADDVLEFSQGEKFQVHEIIGHGNTTLIIGGKFQGSSEIIALRLPLYQGYFRALTSLNVDFDRRRKLLTRGNEKTPEAVKHQDLELSRPSQLTYQDIFNSSIWSQEEYDKLGIPTPKVVASRKNEYIALERVPNFPEFNRPLSLEDVFEKKYDLKKYPDLLKALYEFAEALAPIQKIPDFRAEQVLYHPTQKKWLLADRMGSPSKPIFFSSWNLADHPLVLEARSHSLDLATKIKKHIEITRQTLVQQKSHLCPTLYALFRRAKT
jgi:hypothetical protein